MVGMEEGLRLSQSTAFLLIAAGGSRECGTAMH